MYSELKVVTKHEAILPGLSFTSFACKGKVNLPEIYHLKSTDRLQKQLKLPGLINQVKLLVFKILIEAWRGLVASGLK